MALYDGFFDAVLDESTLQYDRTYNSGDFTGYFEQTVGSGVCIHENENSFKVSWDGTSAVIAPGYLFIQGYWLKNTDDYAIPLTGQGVHAVLAQLNMSARRIAVDTQLKADPETYPDALVLAYVTIDSTGAATVEDTRYRTDICGVIDSAGGLSVKVEWALNYIDNEIDAKLQEAEAAVNAQTLLLDEKIAEVSALVEKLAPPPIGTVKFSASQDIEEGWLPCDGRFVSETDYPELVAALGKKYPSGDKFSLLSEGEIGANITNGVLYAGRLWVYSFNTRTLYGVDVNGADPIKEISVTSSDEAFLRLLVPSTTNPLCLSIVPHTSTDGAKIFLSQIINDGGAQTVTEREWLNYAVILQSEFTGEETHLELVVSFTTTPVTTSSGSTGTVTTYVSWENTYAIPYVLSRVNNGVEEYLVCSGRAANTNGNTRGSAVLSWVDGDGVSTLTILSGFSLTNYAYQRTGFSHKNKGEIVDTNGANVNSFPSGRFTFSGGTGSGDTNGGKSYIPVNVVGSSQLVYSFALDAFPRTPLSAVTLGVGKPGLSFPVAARLFVDAGAYLWGKDIYMFFVGTGILFSRTMNTGDFGYLDTTGVMGTITQHGYLDYSEDEGTLYILGQDTTNKVKVAKMVLNTLFDYANDGAWLPVIASDGIPAYIKAKETGGT